MAAQCTLIDRVASECGALCLLPTTEAESEEVGALAGCNSLFLSTNTSRQMDCRVYHNGDPQAPQIVLTVGTNPHVVEQMVQRGEVQLGATFQLDAQRPVLRICDAREAFFIPKGPTQDQINYAATRCSCPAALIQSRSWNSWDLCEPLQSVNPSFRLVFWTGLDPLEIVRAMTENGLVGWTNHANRWMLSPTASSQVAASQYDTFKAVKAEHGFKCGFDCICEHLIYDICQKALGEAPSGVATFPTNHGVGVAVHTCNNVYAVEELAPLQIDDQEEVTALALQIRIFADDDDQ